VTRWAEATRTVLGPVLERESGRVHFRPSSGGVAMVGLLPERPQRGKSGLRDLQRVAVEFDALFQAHCVDVTQGRPTPEKSLQSAMTAAAYRHDRRMEPLCVDGRDMLFIADELALPQEGGGRMVCDILALRRDAEGYCRPAVIELKSARQLSRLVEQVRDYAACVGALSDDFAELYSAVLGEAIVFDGPPECWIVWPQHGEQTDPREEELSEHGIRVVGYQEGGDGYSYRVGVAP
jgi:hypothetical protein